jgi:hypothetical protein
MQLVLREHEYKKPPTPSATNTKIVHPRVANQAIASRRSVLGRLSPVTHGLLTTITTTAEMNNRDGGKNGVSKILTRPPINSPQAQATNPPNIAKRYLITSI